MSAVRNRKGETCEEQLRRMVKDIAMGINSPEEGETASSWMENTYDIRYLVAQDKSCLLYTSPSPRDGLLSRMPSSA